MKRSAGKSNRTLIIVLAAAVLIGIVGFVPVRTCESCHGVAGFKIGDRIDLTCKGCGGKGKQTIFDIVVSAVRN
jgi:hypothetical protein